MVSNNKSDAAYNEQEGISIVELIKILWRGKWIIAITLIVFLLAASVYSFFIAGASYISTASLSIEQSENPKYDVNTYVQQMSSIEFYDIAAASLKSADQTVTAEQISSSATITANEELSTIRVSVEMADPQMSADVANAIIDSFPAYITGIVKENAEAEFENVEIELAESELLMKEKFNELTSFLKDHAGIDNIQSEIDVLRKQPTDIMVSKNETQNNIEIYSMQLESLYKIAKTYGIELYTDIPTNQSAESSAAGTASYDDDGVYSSVLVSEIAKVQSKLLEEQSRMIALENLSITIQDQLTEKENYYNIHGYEYEQLQNEYTSTKECYRGNLAQLTEMRKTSFSLFGEEHINIEMQAEVPQAPVDTNKFRTIAVLGVIGLVLGGIIVLFRNYWIKEKEKLKK